MRITRFLKEQHLLLFLKMIPDMLWEYWIFTRETVRCGLSSSKSKQQTELQMLAHAIEKGFSLKNVRKDFGVAKIKQIVALLNSYVIRFGYDENLNIPVSLVYAYREFRRSNGNVTDELKDVFARFDTIVQKTGKQPEEFSQAGTITIEREKMLALEHADFQTLALSRHAIRNFGSELGGAIYEKVREAIEIAKHSPSACNRQAYRVHIYKGEQKTNILKAQGSAAPFSEDAEIAIVVTGDMNRYYSFEQHLMYVDASLFAMSLMYALTAKGLANIPLTQCIKRKALKRIRTEFKIPQNEIPVIMLAIGKYPEVMKVARSERMSYNDFTILH